MGGKEWVVPDSSRYVPLVQQEFCAAPGTALLFFFSRVVSRAVSARTGQNGLVGDQEDRLLPPSSILPQTSPRATQRSVLAACISMAMLRRGIPLVPQELLAYKLGLTLPREHVESVKARFFNPRVADDQLIDRPTILPHEPEVSQPAHCDQALASVKKCTSCIPLNAPLCRSTTRARHWHPSKSRCASNSCPCRR